MLHLAQVEKIPASGKIRLRLIAQQRSEYAWAMTPGQEFVPFDEPTEYGEGALVLATLSDTQQIVHLESADRWIIDIIQTFLRSGVTPAFLQEESARAEQWRQNLTLQSQDLDRRALELEARREQIEQLEETLKREKKQMESLAAQYKEQSQELEQCKAELDGLRKQVEHLETSLKEQQQLANFPSSQQKT